MSARLPSPASTANEGFTGEENPLADGTPRWLGRRASDSSIVEVTGAGPISSVSATVPVGADVDKGKAAGAFLATVLNTWAPGSTAYFTKLLDDYSVSGTDFDEERTFGTRTVHFQSLTASDGVLVVVTIEYVG